MSNPANPDHSAAAPSWDELYCHEHDNMARCPGEVIIVTTNADEEDFENAYIDWERLTLKGNAPNLDEFLQQRGYWAVMGQKSNIRTGLIKIPVTLELTKDEAKLVEKALSILTCDSKELSLAASICLKIKAEV